MNEEIKDNPNKIMSKLNYIRPVSDLITISGVNDNGEVIKHKCSTHGKVCEHCKGIHFDNNEFAIMCDTLYCPYELHKIPTEIK